MSFSQMLEAGQRHFDVAQYQDALSCFEGALELEPESREARLAYNRAIQVLVPRYHFGMLDDAERNSMFDAAIARAVEERKTVLDVGTGSGLLSMMAARAGAQVIYTCEAVSPIAEIARTVVERNGYADQIEVIGKHSSHLTLGQDIPERLDLLVTETIDSTLIGEGMLAVIRDARDRLLRDDAQIIPGRAELHAVAIESTRIHAMNHASTAGGFDVTPFNSLRTEGAIPVRLGHFEHRYLCKPFELCRFDFANDPLEPRQLRVTVPAVATGTCHAIATWFDVHLDEHTTLSSQPGADRTHWKQGLYCVREPIPVCTGQPLTLEVFQDVARLDFELSVGT